MFRSSTILSELIHSLATITFLLKYSVKVRRCILCGDVAACHGTACVLFVVQTDTSFRLRLITFCNIGMFAAVYVYFVLQTKGKH